MYNIYLRPIAETAAAYSELNMNFNIKSKINVRKNITGYKH